ncbi:hypothetical protein L3Q82_013462 [Scortum barcoo]|uniref:Uncharacterized protein n=1 Tax=Scortum barcoo TaxID=214431 RepID=A0ACB8W0P6_9TELE|nr:hypothetical protein L3Q82_013462 [Scortum barcoo]
MWEPRITTFKFMSGSTADSKTTQKFHEEIVTIIVVQSLHQRKSANNTQRVIQTLDCDPDAGKGTGNGTEGDSIMAECAANCNPQPHTYSWLKRQMGQTIKVNSTERKMSFSNTMRDTFLSCIAHNDMGAGQSDWLDLDVQCKNIFISTSSNVPKLIVTNLIIISLGSTAWD